MGAIGRDVVASFRLLNADLAFGCHVCGRRLLGVSSITDHQMINLEEGPTLKVLVAVHTEVTQACG